MLQQTETRRAPVRKPLEKRPRTPNVDKLIAKTEREIARLEARLAELDALAKENASDYQKLLELAEKKEELDKSLTALYEKWEELNA